MNKIYLEIAELSEKFKEMCYGITHNKTDIEDAVQELYIYFLSMNPSVLKNIYEKDGINGIVRYGAVVLKRALTSKRSPFYYKYKKYYTHINNYYTTNSSLTNKEINRSIENLCKKEFIGTEKWKKLEKIDEQLDKMFWYDSSIFKLYYYEGNTLDSLAKKTGISRNSLFTTIDKVREILKEELNE